MKHWLTHHQKPSNKRQGTVGHYYYYREVLHQVRADVLKTHSWTYRFKGGELIQSHQTTGKESEIPHCERSYAHMYSPWFFSSPASWDRQLEPLLYIMGVSWSGLLCPNGQFESKNYLFGMVKKMGSLGRGQGSGGKRYLSP